MPISELRLIKHCREHLVQEAVDRVPSYTRGVYVLFKYRPRTKKYDVVYIGMAGGETAGIRSRLRSHRKKKKKQWTHFSVFEVWDNIREEEVQELEGLFRHFYRYDTRAGKLNKQKSFRKLIHIRKRTRRTPARATRTFVA